MNTQTWVDCHKDIVVYCDAKHSPCTMYVITISQQSLRFSQLRLALLRHVPDLLPHLQPLERELLHRVEVGEQEGHLQQGQCQDRLQLK